MSQIFIKGVAKRYLNIYKRDDLGKNSDEKWKEPQVRQLTMRRDKAMQRGLKDRKRQCVRAEGEI